MVVVGENVDVDFDSKGGGTFKQSRKATATIRKDQGMMHKLQHNSIKTNVWICERGGLRGVARLSVDKGQKVG